MKTLRNLLIIALITTGNFLTAQTTGIVRGNITDKDGAPIFGAVVRLMDDSTMVTGATTDPDGSYIIKEITPGEYDIEIASLGMAKQRIRKVNIDPEQVAYVSTRMNPGDNTLKEVVIEEKVFEKTIVNPLYTTMTAIRHDQIEKIPVTPGDIISIIVGITPGVLATDDGKNLYVRGSRSGSTQYIVDGNKVMASSSTAVPGLGIEGIEVLTGGVPAEYGDCTGGIVIITTKDYKWEMRKKEMQRRDREEALKKKKG